MVSLTKCKLTIAVGVFVAACLVTAIWALRSGYNSGDAVHAPTAPANGGRETNASSDVVSLPGEDTTVNAFTDPTLQTTPDEATTAELASICGTLVQAYSNREASVIEKWSGRLHGMVASLELSYEQREEAISPLEDIILRDFYVVPRNAQLMTFPDAGSLSRHLNTLFYGILLIGDELLMQDRSRYAPVAMEGRMFSILKDFKTRYALEGKKDFEDAVDEVLSKWAAFVESERGYTRRHVIECLESVIRSSGVGTREAELENMNWDDYVAYRVGNSASFLLECGYRPKWIDEIKNVPEPEWRKRERANARSH